MFLTMIILQQSHDATVDSPEDGSAEQVTIELKTDYSTKELSEQEITSIVPAWQVGAITGDTMDDLFGRGEVLRDAKTS